MQYFIVSHTDCLFQDYIEDYYRLRHIVFKEKLNWSVNTVEGNKEIDNFDFLDEVYYVLVIDKEKLVGGMRLLPTLNDYMIEKVFPQLLENIPKEKDIWEISRFTIDPEYQKGASMMTLNTVTLLLLKGMCEFGKIKNLKHYVAATTQTLNRLVRKINLDTEVIGHTLIIESTKVIALKVNMNEQSYNAIDQALLKELSFV